MNSKKCTPAVKKAVTYLRSMLDNYTWIAGDMLPSINQLAAAAGVSSVPMWKAVNLLAEEDILEVIQGSGTRVKKDLRRTCEPGAKWMDGAERPYSQRYPQWLLYQWCTDAILKRDENAIRSQLSDSSQGFRLPGKRRYDNS
jgi:DNA-binding transcriptional MocR family regulator